MLTDINLSSHYRYIGIFLSLNCNLSCSYCINHTVGLNQKVSKLSGDDWIKIINRIQSSRDIPITLQGGEPSIHRDFFKILNGIDKDKSVDLLTNLQFSPEKFIKEIPVSRFERDLPYPAIRVSYHPETMELDKTLDKILILQNAGYSIGLYSVDHPSSKKQIRIAREKATKLNIIFKTKEFLGEHDGERYGEYMYPGAVFSSQLSTVQCRTSEMLVSPEGIVYRCHHDLYNKISPLGSLLSNSFIHEEKFRECAFFGKCNPCDIKLKNNYLQKFGHCSVEIQH